MAGKALRVSEKVASAALPLHGCEPWQRSRRPPFPEAGIAARGRPTPPNQPLTLFRKPGRLVPGSRKEETEMATKMPKLPVIHSPWEWQKYQTQLIQYQKEQLGRQKAKIAALERKVKRLQEQSEKDWEWFRKA